MPAQVSNRLLTSLSRECRELLTSKLTAISLPLRTVLHVPDQPLQYAYFMTSGIASVVTPMEDGGIAEVELIGAEGVVGSFHLLGSAPVSTGCFIQLAGTALRMEMTELMHAFHSSDEIRSRFLESIQVRALTVSQMAGCNRLHEAEARLARWLLMAQDRIQSDILPFTQEFLAEMLGAQRTTVTVVAGSLQRSGLIEYRHGEVRIKDRDNLEAAACDCYKITKRLYSNLYKKSAAYTAGGPNLS
jgi:CRP-like cAMP-binding protein